MSDELILTLFEVGANCRLEVASINSDDLLGIPLDIKCRLANYQLGPMEYLGLNTAKLYRPGL
jgi:hypothetical protein